MADARTLIDLLQDIEPVVRKDIYVKADSDVGVKRRVRARGTRRPTGSGVAWVDRHRLNIMYL